MIFDPTRPFVIGEVAQAHDGSLGTAHAYIDAIANAGADAVKFQTHIAAAESTPREKWRVSFSYEDATRFDYWKRMEFTEGQWASLKKHAEEKGLQFLSSPFSLEAAHLLRRIGLEAWKVASGETGNTQLFDYLVETGLPIMLSTGMSAIDEIDAAVRRVQSAGLPLAVMQCTSAYPCPPEKVGLNMLALFRERYGCAVGLSDHSGTIFPSLAAAALGAEVIEVHVTLSRECFGPDVAASVTTSELKSIMEGVRFIERMRSVVVDKDKVAAEMAPLRRLFTKSIVAEVDLPVGSLLTQENVSLKKPGTGIPAEKLPGIIGRRLRRRIAAGEMLTESHFCDQNVQESEHSY